MNHGDLSTNPILETLTPPSAVREAEGHSPHPDAQGRSRRRSRPADRPLVDEDSSSGPSDYPPHQFDDLA